MFQTQQKHISIKIDNQVEVHITINNNANESCVNLIETNNLTNKLKRSSSNVQLTSLTMRKKKLSVESKNNTTQGIFQFSYEIFNF